VVVDFVRESLQTPTADEVRQTAIRLLRPLVDGGYVEAGTLASTGFEAWRV
jgi:hypothetical protein